METDNALFQEASATMPLDWARTIIPFSPHHILPTLSCTHIPRTRPNSVLIRALCNYMEPAVTEVGSLGVSHVTTQVMWPLQKHSPLPFTVLPFVAVQGCRLWYCYPFVCPLVACLRKHVPLVPFIPYIFHPCVCFTIYVAKAFCCGFPDIFQYIHMTHYIYIWGSLWSLLWST